VPAVRRAVPPDIIAVMERGYLRIMASLLLAATPLCARAACSLEDVAFMEGVWRVDDGGSHGEERWTRTAANTLAGSAWVAKGTALSFAEALSIVAAEDGTVEMHLRHFDGTLSHAWEEKDAPMIFRAARCEANTAVFDGIGAKQGEHITYQRSGDELAFVGDFLRKGAPFRVELRMRAAETAGLPPIASAIDDPVVQLVGRLDLNRYKATIKELTRFGDRRQGTDRNRAAIDWIEAQLKLYGCGDIARLRYSYTPGQKRSPSGPAVVAPGAAQGGGRFRGERAATGVNDDPQRQSDEKLRELNSQPSSPGDREEVYCTKVGSRHPDEMYLVGAHMDGIGWGEAANDDGSGAALVMELARVLSAADVQTDRSVRFVLWNNEETGLNGAYAYVEQRAKLQGIESPAGSGRYPEPRWLGMVQHDMVLFDHGMPRADGTLSPSQRPEADVNIEFQSQAKQAEGAQRLAWAFYAANEAYAADYPASVGPHMTNTDSTPFMNLIPAISVRENERGTQIGAGWDPQWHQPTDLYATYSDADFRLGLNAAQTTLGAIARLAGASLNAQSAH
jgi:hypothetical protein